MSYQIIIIAHINFEERCSYKVKAPVFHYNQISIIFTRSIN